MKSVQFLLTMDSFANSIKETVRFTYDINIQILENFFVIY